MQDDGPKYGDGPTHPVDGRSLPDTDEPRQDAYSMITDSLVATEPKAFQENGWGKRHVDFWRKVSRGGAWSMHVHNDGAAIVVMVEGWARYADRHFDRYESLIGDDGVLGPAWEAIGDSLLTLLNGECGALDCGTVDALIRGIMQTNGVDMENR